VPETSRRPADGIPHRARAGRADHGEAGAEGRGGDVGGDAVIGRRAVSLVMAGLVPAIHVF
jgi:hypothetical protein